jgi:hypothetical protein
MAGGRPCLCNNKITGQILTTNLEANMSATTKIHVTACDNELYILATNPTPGMGTIELCHIMSGFNSPIDYAIFPQSVLPKGTYTLIMVGINWGGPQAFKVILTTNGVNTEYTAPTSTTVGANWTKSVQITV